MWTAREVLAGAGRRASRAARPLGGAALAALLALAPPGCDRRGPFTGGQPAGWIASASFEAGPGAPIRLERVPPARASAGWPWLPHLQFERHTAERKLDPRLRRWLGTRAGGEPLEVLIEYVDPVAMPRFPVEAGDPTVDAAGDSAALVRCAAVADSLTGLRAPWYGVERLRLATNHAATMTDSFWISRAVVARLPAREVRRIARRGDVRHVQFAHRGGPAPAYCDGLPPLAERLAVTGDGRSVLASDVLRDAGYGYGRIGLLDTGVWTGHALLAGPASSTATFGPALQALDCVSEPDCEGGDGMDTDIGPGGHGTITCGILVGDASMGACLEGVTRARVLSHRVYAPDAEIPEGEEGRGVLDPVAYKHACERLLRRRPPIAVVEVADEQGPYGSLSHTAGRLFAAGVAVIAAAGNGHSAASPGDSWIGSPGDHPWVISVGARDVKEISRTADSQSRGIVGYRTKPDLQAPTETQSAGIGDDGEKHLTSYSGTSGATPYVAGAALLLRNWMRGPGTGPWAADPDPGQVYAALLACGGNVRSEKAGSLKVFPVAEGAGLVRLPTRGRGYWGKLVLGSHGSATIPLGNLPAGVSMLRVAIWWPDPLPFQFALPSVQVVPHSDFDLEVTRAGTGEVVSSSGVSGVYERVTVKTEGHSIGWQVRVRSKAVGLSARPVYLAVIAN